MVLCAKNATELKFANATKLFRKIKDQGINNNFKITLKNWSSGLKNCRYCSILGNGNAYTQGMETLALSMDSRLARCFLVCYSN